tara:strand:+ start:698 stop:928 length:231 start_codon:yes stop_codon:yes gene_type:complete
MDNQNEMLEAIHYLNSRLLDISNSLKGINKTLKNLDNGICTWVDDNRNDGKKIVSELDDMKDAMKGIQSAIYDTEG